MVITHDEEFVRSLGRSDVADYYFRVSKDLSCVLRTPLVRPPSLTRNSFSRGRSQIHKQNIANLT